METFWYSVLTFMLAMYVVLDGYDFGVGMLYPFVARSEEERRTVLASIGPVWTGNEVWLIGSGGVLFFAFPKAYAAGFSGFYLALIMVLWLLIFRGLALELRLHVDHTLWRQFWDVTFAAASFLLAVVFGVALGNLVRGVPLDSDGYFFVALWTDFLPGTEPGTLDWFTVLMGLASIAILAFHGARYLAMKTEGELRGRVSGYARAAAWVVLGLAGLAMLIIPFVQPLIPLNYQKHPQGYLFTIAGALALLAAIRLAGQQRDIGAFAASSLFILAMLGSVAWGCYPNILIATTDPSNSLTIFNATAGSYGLQVGVLWFAIAFVLVLAYQIYAHAAFWGKVRPALDSAPAE
jgi:cytochrome d ubiquinol oxidase subunit II